MSEIVNLYTLNLKDLHLLLLLLLLFRSFIINATSRYTQQFSSIGKRNKLKVGSTLSFSILLTIYFLLFIAVNWHCNLGTSLCWFLKDWLLIFLLPIFELISRLLFRDYLEESWNLILMNLLIAIKFWGSPNQELSELHARQFAHKTELISCFLIDSKSIESEK